MKAVTIMLASALSLLTKASVIPQNATSSCLNRRQEQFETQVEVGDNTVSAVWIYTPESGQNPENHPGTEAFTELFEGVYGLCGSTQCGLDQSSPMEFCTDPVNPDISNGNRKICLQAVGSFGSASKDDMFNLGRAAFDGSVVRTYQGPDDGTQIVPQVTEAGASFIHIVTGPAYQGGSGYDLSFNLFYDYNDEGCGSIVDRIVDVGSVAADKFAPVFGLVGIICDSASGA